MESTNPPRRIVWAIVAVTVFIIILVIVSIAIKSSTQKSDTTQSTASTATEEKVATKSEVQQNLTDLNNSVKQATKDQAAANAVLKSSESQIKASK